MPADGGVMMQTVNAMRRDVDRMPTAVVRGGWASMGVRRNRAVAARLASDVPIGFPADARDPVVVCGRISA
ncbi:hypothetical protein GA0115254_108014 [Streptomyces sp. Ncost-T10-10d]|nr:hypothetical protein GA0115254_108014 [Streptomyces sp. Ncost-T10-10d]